MSSSCCLTSIKPGTIECDSKCERDTCRVLEVGALVIAVTVLAVSILAILARYDIVPQTLNFWSATPTCPCPYSWGIIGLFGTAGTALIVYKFWPVLGGFKKLFNEDRENPSGNPPSASLSTGKPQQNKKPAEKNPFDED